MKGTRASAGKSLWEAALGGFFVTGKDIERKEVLFGLGKPELKPEVGKERLATVWSLFLRN